MYNRAWVSRPNPSAGSKTASWGGVLGFDVTHASCHNLYPCSPFTFWYSRGPTWSLPFLPTRKDTVSIAPQGKQRAQYDCCCCTQTHAKPFIKHDIIGIYFRIAFDSLVTSFDVSVCPAVCQNHVSVHVAAFVWGTNVPGKEPCFCACCCFCLRYKCAREAFLDGVSWNPRCGFARRRSIAPKTPFLQDPAVVKSISIIEDFQNGSLNLETMHAMFVMCVFRGQFVCLKLFIHGCNGKTKYVVTSVCIVFDLVPHFQAVNARKVTKCL